MIFRRILEIITAVVISDIRGSDEIGETVAIQIVKSQRAPLHSIFMNLLHEFFRKHRRSNFDRQSVLFIESIDCGTTMRILEKKYLIVSIGINVTRNPLPSNEIPFWRSVLIEDIIVLRKFVVRKHRELIARPREFSINIFKNVNVCFCKRTKRNNQIREF